jgi:hypothetical protein
MYWQLGEHFGSDGHCEAAQFFAVVRRPPIVAIRTTQTVVRFSSAFLLPGFDKPQPAGDYRVVHDEEPIDSISWLVWHRTASFIFLPAIGVQAAMRQMVPTNPEGLAAALEKDKEKS